MSEPQSISAGNGRLAAAVTGLLLTVALLTPTSAWAIAGPPIPSATAVSGATTGSAKLEATLNPNGKVTTYLFQYIPLSAWKADGEQFGEGTLTTPTQEAEGSEAIEVSATLTELEPATPYRARLFAENSKGQVTGEDLLLATYAPPLVGLPDGRAFEQASPVDKDGQDVTGTVPLVKASPSGDAVTFSSTVGIPGGTSAQTFPTYLARRTQNGGEGRWSTRGLLPPAEAGQKANVLGWTPGFGQVFDVAAKLGSPLSLALLGQPGEGGTPTPLTPYTPEPTSYSYAGASANGSVVIFESKASFGSPAGIEGASNVYAWDRETGALSLLSVSNQGEAAEGAFAGPYDWALGNSSVNLSRGGSNAHYYIQNEHAVAKDGSAFFTEAGTGQLYERLNPTEPQSAVVHAGEADEECTEPDKACTVHVSASERTEGKGPEGHDAAGTEPAAFLAASEDGSTAYFSSAEKLTNDATTGPEPQPAQIGTAKLNGSGAANPVDPEFLSARGIGVAVAGEYLYWADPQRHAIGRAKLNASGEAEDPEPEFLPTGETKAEAHPHKEPGAIEFFPSFPRYVAVANGHIYWTNPGPPGEDKLFGNPVQALDEGGTIGRAALDGSGNLVPGSIEPECITGASNPQGIAVNSEHIYWANAGSGKDFRPISRAEVNCEGVEMDFQGTKNSATFPLGVALDGSYVYWSELEDGVMNPNASITRIPLEGGSEESIFIGQHENLRGIALDDAYVYWTAQKDGSAGAIGRLALSEFGNGNCEDFSSCDREFTSPVAGSLNGLAQQGEHLYWTTNGETPRNLGNDLYRYSAVPDSEGHHLSDLTVDEAIPFGAEVQGVVGTTADGQTIYFVANGVLTNTPNEEEEVATPGDCKGFNSAGNGNCNLYRLEVDGKGHTTIAFVVRLDAQGLETQSDSVDWAPTSGLSSVDHFQHSAFLSADSRTLVFRSQRRLTPYDNQGVPEFYRYQVGQGTSCLTCNPTGQAAVVGTPSQPFGLPPALASIGFSNIHPESPAVISSRNLSADGDRFFFESTEALALNDSDRRAGCPPWGSANQRFAVRTCQDVYEWEALAAGSCREGSPDFSPLNEGCLYLLSNGEEAEPSFFADASESGDDAFIFTRAQEVGQDKDNLLDVYDARVGGGIASQNQAPPPVCEGEACREGLPSSAQAKPPATALIKGTGNVHEAPRCLKGKKLVRRKGKARCAKPRKGGSGHGHKRNHHRHRRAQR